MMPELVLTLVQITIVMIDKMDLRANRTAISMGRK
jgi:hypothetical protein